MNTAALQDRGKNYIVYIVITIKISTSIGE